MSKNKIKSKHSLFIFYYLRIERKEKTHNE